MDRRTLGKTGLQVSTIGFGGASIGFLDTDQDQVARLLATLLDGGVNVIDTAAYYKNSEQLIGNAIGHRRREYILISKCGTKLPEISAAPYTSELITFTVDRALRNLRTDHLDVMLLHSADLPTLQKGDALDAVMKARDAGKIRFAGVSADNEAAAYAATLPDVTVLETTISIADQANIDTVLPAAQQHQVGVIAKRPLANGAWDPAAIPDYFRNYAKVYIERFQQMQLTPEQFDFDSSDAEAWPELMLRFTLSHPAVHTAIIGMTEIDHATANIRHATRGPFPRRRRPNPRLVPSRRFLPQLAR
jgi:aryl-alcohol dehydrogenase-like predicted oxidoreductase